MMTPASENDDRRSLTVQVPASTSNCGSGFDTLSLALTLYNFVRLELRESGAVESLGEQPLPDSAVEMATELVEAYAKEAKLPRAPGVAFEVWGDIPMARGLGSSATVRGGLLYGLNCLHNDRLDVPTLIRLASRLEQAPDNAAAVFLGGFCVSRTCKETGDYLDTLRFPLSDQLAFNVVSPNVQVLTREAREILPESIRFSDAARTVNSVAYLVAAMVSGQFEQLSIAVEDYLHEPYRERLCAYAREVIVAGVAAGAYTGWISGSGSSILCVSPVEQSLKVGQAMLDIYRSAGIDAQLFPLHTDNEGVRLVDRSQ